MLSSIIMGKYFGMFLFLFVSIMYIQCYDDNFPNLEEKYQKTVLECAKELNLDPRYFLPNSTTIPKEPFDPSKLSCMKKCTWQKRGYVDQKMQFQEDNFRADTPDMPTDHVNIFKHCFNETAKSIVLDCAAFGDFDFCVEKEFRNLRNVKI